MGIPLGPDLMEPSDDFGFVDGPGILWKPFFNLRQALGASGGRNALDIQGYLAHKKTHPLGPYRRPMPSVLGGF